MVRPGMANPRFFAMQKHFLIDMPVFKNIFHFFSENCIIFRP